MARPARPSVTEAGADPALTHSTEPDSLRPLSDAMVTDALLWALLDAVPDGLVLVDAGGQMLLVNTHLEEMFGYDRGELLGQSVDLLLPERARTTHARHRAAFIEDPRIRAMGLGLDLVGRQRAGHDIPIDIRLSHLDTPDGLCVIAAVREDTARRIAIHDREVASLSDQNLRIARELGDTVVRSIYSAGLRLHTLMPQTTESVRSEMTALVADLDAIISEIRNILFPIGGSSHRSG